MLLEREPPSLRLQLAEEEPAVAAERQGRPARRRATRVRHVERPPAEQPGALLRFALVVIDDDLDAVGDQVLQRLGDSAAAFVALEVPPLP